MMSMPQPPRKRWSRTRKACGLAALASSFVATGPGICSRELSLAFAASLPQEQFAQLRISDCAAASPSLLQRNRSDSATAAPLPLGRWSERRWQQHHGGSSRAAAVARAAYSRHEYEGDKPHSPTRPSALSHQHAFSKTSLARRALLAVAAVFGGLSLVGTEKAVAEEVPAMSTRTPVVDETGLLTTNTKKHLDRVLLKLEEDTQLKLRVICPPNGLQRDREAFRQYVQPIKEAWGANAYSMVIVAENRINPRTGRALPLLTIQPGFRLQEKFQYRLTQDYILGTADRFGFPPTVNQDGTDVCLLRATENAAACLFDLADTSNVRHLRPLEPDEVAKIFNRHGLQPLLV